MICTRICVHALVASETVSNVSCYDPSAGSGTLLMNLANIIGDERVIPNLSRFVNPKLIIKLKNPFIHGTLLIKKEVIESVGNYDERFLYSQDYKLFKDLFEAGYKIKNLNEALYFLNTINNISSKFESEQKYFANCVRKNLIP